MTIITPYYEDMSRFSNSNIGWLINKGPRYLRDMLDGKEEGLKGSFLVKGTMIHMYILQKEDFWKEYQLQTFDIPSSKQQKDLCEAYIRLFNKDPFLPKEEIALTSYKSAYSNQKSDTIQLEESLAVLDKYEEYIDYAKNINKKILISQYELQMLKTIEANVKNHKFANALLYNIPITTEAHNEFHINWDYTGTDKSINIPCKSLIDRCMIDHVTKTITLIDIKTTMDVYKFKHSVEEFDYNRQLAFYTMAITWYMTKVKNIDISEYDLKIYIIAIQNNGKHEVRVFDMLNEKTLLDNKTIIVNALNEIAYHINTNRWDHTKAYYENNGCEELK